MTPAEVAEDRIADPEWHFGDDPNNAVHDATLVATEHDINGRPRNAAFWTHVACILVEAADNPHVPRGLVLTGLVAEYGDGLPAEA